MEPQLPQTLHELEDDLSQLAHKKGASGSTSQVLSSSVQNLQGSVDELLLMFKRANEELTLEQREEQLIKTQLEPINKRLQELSEQQETIASAIVSVSDAIDGLVNSVNEVKARLSGMDLTTAATRMPSQLQSSGFPPQSQSSRPTYQRFEFGSSGNMQNAMQSSQRNEAAQLPPPPPLNQAIPNIQPNEFGDKKRSF